MYDTLSVTMRGQKPKGVKFYHIKAKLYYLVNPITKFIYIFVQQPKYEKKL